jgi:1-deoxy-D-xylulose-5-phosphate reductoisomerase
MAAIVGAAGLPPCMAAARAGKRLLLANKEALVVGGALFMQAVQQGGATLLPIDSEHSAIFQCLPEDRGLGARIDHIVLTASAARSAGATRPRCTTSRPRRPGAPELGDGPQDLGRLGDDDEQGARGDRGALAVRPGARAHPVVIHPQSIVHSMVVCRDASVLAQLGTPDMRCPSPTACRFPQRIESGAARLDFTALSALTFEPMDLQRFPGLQLAYDACAAPEARPRC